MIYIVSNYEKGNISQCKRISCRRRQQIRQSVGIMTEMISLIDNGISRSRCEEVLDRVIAYIKSQENVMIAEVSQAKLGEFKGGVLCEPIIEPPDRKAVTGMIKDILSRLFRLLDSTHLKHREREYMCACFHALHNLSRAMLEKGQDTLFEIDMAVSVDDAIRYANKWLTISPDRSPSPS